jgi:hypothetical protein
VKHRNAASWLESLTPGGVRLAPALWGAAAATLVALSGCGPVRLIANTNIPAPLVVKMPMGIALFVPPEFSSYVHKEERWSTDYNVELGKAQTESLTRLMSAMFERVVTVDSVNAGTQLGSSVQAILEPSIEEYAFVTPRDAGSPFYAVSIKYRVNVYLPDGKLADSWGFTGYGTSPSQGLSSAPPLAAATALAMRDAGAKLAVEFRDQQVVRGLLPESVSVDAPPPGTQAAPQSASPGTPPGTSSTGAGATPAATDPAQPTPPAAAQPGSVSPSPQESEPSDEDGPAKEPAETEKAAPPPEQNATKPPEGARGRS